MITKRTNATSNVFLAAIVILFAGLSSCQSPLFPDSVGPTSEDLGGRVEQVTFAASRFSQNAYMPVVEEYNAHKSGFSVQYIPIEDSLYLGPESASLLASAADTTVILPGIGNATFANYFLDLQPLIDSDPSFDTSGFIPGIMQACREDERTIGIPLSSSPTLIFYDPDAFTSANLPIPQPGWTWVEFEQTVRELSLTQNDGSYGFVPNGEPLQLLAPLISEDLEASQGKWNPATLFESLEWYFRLAREGAVPSIPGDKGWIERDQELITGGRAILWIDSGQNLQYWRNILGENVSVVPFPISSRDRRGQFNPSTAVCASISGGVSDRQGAWEWLKFLSSRPTAHQDFFFPARSEASGSGMIWEGLDEHSRAALRFALEHAWYGSPYQASVQAAGQALETAMAGQASLDVALAGADVPGVEALPSVGLTPVVIDTPRPVVTSGDAVRIDYYGSPWVHYSTRSLESLATEFNQTHPEIHVRATGELPAEPGVSIHITEMAEQVDCFAWPFTPSQEWIDSFYSLDEFLARGDLIRPADYNPTDLEAFRIADRLYGLPASSLPHVIYYNAGRLAQLGLERVDMDWAFEEFLTLAGLAAREDAFGFVPYQAGYLTFLMAGRGVNWFDPERDPAVLPLDDPEIMNAVLWLKDLVETGVIPPAFGESAAAERERLVETGRALFWNQYAFLTNGVDEVVQSEYEIGVAPPPHLSGLLPAPVLSGLYISQRAENPEACWQWLSFLSDQPHAFSGVPSRLSIASSDEWESVFTQPGGSIDLASVYQAAASRPALIQPADHFIQTWLEQAVQAVVRGEDPYQGLSIAQEMASTYQACLDDSSKPGQDQRLACAKQADPRIEGP